MTLNWRRYPGGCASFIFDLRDERGYSRRKTLEAQTTQDNFDKEMVDRHFFEDLIRMQKALASPDSIGSDEFSLDPIENLAIATPLETNLRRLLKTKSALRLGVVERNSIELLARIFDFIFADRTLRDDIKKLIAQLQIPMLRVALSDIDFFHARVTSSENPDGYLG